MPVESDNSAPLDGASIQHSAQTAADQWRPGSGMAAGTSSAQSEASSNKLVDKKIIPHIELAHSHADGAQSGHVGQQKKDWTVAVDLGVSFAPDKENPQGAGTDRELGEIQKLAAETKGKSVNFVVHAERPVDAQGKLCAQPDGDKAGACVNDALKNNRARTERYFVHDGRVNKLPDANYKSPQEDLEHLVNDAGQLSPSKKLGLLSFMHGTGSQGVKSNLGFASLDQTVDGIQKGLKSTGHQKLDLLDYDSCDMGEAAVMDKSRKVAKDVVASSGVEVDTDTNDAQNLPAALRSVLADSKMSGRDFGDKIVEQDKQGIDGKGDNNGLPTAANFDLSKYPAFKNDLDRFGAALSTAARDKDNLKQIQSDIEKTARPNTGLLEAEQNKRTLKDFAQHILESSQAGRFHSDNKPLEDAASHFLKSVEALTTSSYGEPDRGDEKAGGLAAELPGKEILDSQKVAQEYEPLHMLQNELKIQMESKPKPGMKPQLADMVDSYLHDLDPDLSAKHPDELAKIKAATDAMTRTPDQASFRAAGQRLLDTVSKAASGPLGRESEAEMGGTQMQAEFLKKPYAPLTTKWDEFVNRLKQQTS